jgi:hypothetical protein
MGCFTMLPTVLERLEQQIPGDRAERTRVVNYHLRTTLDYRRLTQPDHPAISYDDPAVRLAYIYKYVTAHAQLVGQRILRSAALADLMQQKVSITCLGGGPGSEVLGFNQAVAELPSPLAVRRHAVLLDREAAWFYDWTNIADEFDLPVSYAALPLDVTQSDSYRHARNAFQLPDLVTAVFFLSEVYNVRDQARPCLERLAAFMKPGSVFFYLDNYGDHFWAWCEAVFEQAGFHQVDAGDIPRWRMPTAEQVEDLGDYAHRFAHAPTLTRNIAWRVLKKEPA